MTSSLLQQVRRFGNLYSAWRVVRASGKASKSETIRDDIKLFEDTELKNLKSIQSKLVHGSFVFQPSIGIPAKKKGKPGFRPTVLAKVDARIVQRAVLNVLLNVEDLKPYFLNPYSFGGIKKQDDQDFAAVPAAIHCVLTAVAAGAEFAACADISSFFTRISKSQVAEIVGRATTSPDFMLLFNEAIKVELENLAELREKAAAFPIEDIGVAQGNSLSPLLGNVVLHEFDCLMNEGDCRCFRYIDDFIILGPTAATVRARLKKAKSILNGLKMDFASDKTSAEPIPLSGSIEFLGIEICPGIIRPSSKARAELLRKIRVIADHGSKSFRGFKAGKQLKKPDALINTLRRMDGTVQGWSKHYWFCNDQLFFENLDKEVSAIVRQYLGSYSAALRGSASGASATLLGLERLGELHPKHFKYPKVMQSNKLS